MTDQTSYTLHFRSPSGDLLSWEQFHSNGYYAAGEAFKAALAREYPDGKGGTEATWILLRKTEKDALEQALKSIETGTLALRATLKAQVQLADALEKAVPFLVRLGDFIGNGEPDRVGYPSGSLADRCATIGAAKDALHGAGRPS